METTLNPQYESSAYHGAHDCDPPISLSRVDVTDCASLLSGVQIPLVPETGCLRHWDLSLLKFSSGRGWSKVWVGWCGSSSFFFKTDFMGVYLICEELTHWKRL